MKLYEVNQAIEDIFERMVDPETGEIIGDDALMEELGALQMERSRILEYLAKLVLNNKASIESIKEEERRLRERRGTLERKTEKIMEILDRECAGQKTDCGVATFCYRKTARVEVSDLDTAVAWLDENGHKDCYRIPAPEISKTEVKRLLTAGSEVPGVELVQDYSCSLR